MRDRGNQAEAQPNHHTTGFWQHICEEWPATVFVVAVITIIHVKYGWFDAIDRYALIVASNLTAFDRGGSSRNEEPEVVVIGIDDETHEGTYLQRSPLDRCALLNDLEVIYKSKPRLLAVDLDLSPVIWPQTLTPEEVALERQAKCQEQLYSLIKLNAKDNVKTVLMAPFKVSARYAENNKTWMSGMQEKGVRFGNASLPVEHGFVFRRYISPRMFSMVVYCLDEYGWNNTPLEEKDSVCLCSQSLNAPYALDRLINFNNNGPGVKTALINFKPYVSSRITTTLPELSDREEAYSTLKDRVVFFGARYGQDDSFLTVLGDMYGVDVHAAGYLSVPKDINSLEDHGGHTLKLVIELAYAFLFGVVISFFWRHYFKLNTSMYAMPRQMAAVYLAGLIACFLVLLIIFCLVSLKVLEIWAIWLSPVPIAVGMFVESFVSGSVLEVAHAQKKTDWPENPIKRLCHSFAKFFYLDCKRLWQKEDELTCHPATPQHELNPAVGEPALIVYEDRRTGREWVVLEIPHKLERAIHFPNWPWNKTASVVIGIRRFVWLLTILYAAKLIYFNSH